MRRSRRSGLGLLAGVSLPLFGRAAPAQAKKKKKVTLCDQGVCIALRCGNGGPCAAFLTHGVLGTSLNGAAGGDQLCQAVAATNPSLNGRVFNAWLSEAQNTAAARFANQDKAGPYRLVANASAGNNAPPTVANNFSDLTECGADGVQFCIRNPINRKVDGSADGVISAPAWTGTDTTGELGADTCSDWTNAGGQGQVGSTAATSNTWTALESQPCGTSLNALYCFEQAT